jgi:hypothetical protein
MTNKQMSRSEKKKWQLAGKRAWASRRNQEDLAQDIVGKLELLSEYGLSVLLKLCDQPVK